MIVSKLLTKELLNSMRIFENKFKSSTFRIFKNFVTSIIKKKTTVVSHLFDENKTSSSKKKFVEKVSAMLSKLTYISSIVKK